MTRKQMISEMENKVNDLYMMDRAYWTVEFFDYLDRDIELIETLWNNYHPKSNINRYADMSKDTLHKYNSIIKEIEKGRNNE